MSWQIITTALGLSNNVWHLHWIYVKWQFGRAVEQSTIPSARTEKIVKIIATLAKYKVWVLIITLQCLSCHHNDLLFCSNLLTPGRQIFHHEFINVFKYKHRYFYQNYLTECIFYPFSRHCILQLDSDADVEGIFEEYQFPTIVQIHSITRNMNVLHHVLIWNQ
jgi:hypothetical protein